MVMLASMVATPPTNAGCSLRSPPGSLGRSYSSRMSPTSSSVMSSSVTMPSVPPYSSMTTAKWMPRLRSSSRLGSSLDVPGSEMPSRVTSATVVALGSRTSSRSRTCTKPITSSKSLPVTG